MIACIAHKLIVWYAHAKITDNLHGAYIIAYNITKAFPNITLLAGRTSHIASDSQINIGKGQTTTFSININEIRQLEKWCHYNSRIYACRETLKKCHWKMISMKEAYKVQYKQMAFSFKYYPTTFMGTVCLTHFAFLFYLQ